MNDGEYDGDTDDDSDDENDDKDDDEYDDKYDDKYDDMHRGFFRPWKHSVRTSPQNPWPLPFYIPCHSHYYISYQGQLTPSPFYYSTPNTELLQCFDGSARIPDA